VISPEPAGSWSVQATSAAVRVSSTIVFPLFPQSRHRRKKKTLFTTMRKGSSQFAAISQLQFRSASIQICHCENVLPAGLMFSRREQLALACARARRLAERGRCALIKLLGGFWSSSFWSRSSWCWGFWGRSCRCFYFWSRSFSFGGWSFSFGSRSRSFGVWSFSFRSCRLFRGRCWSVGRGLGWSIVWLGCSFDVALVRRAASTYAGSCIAGIASAGSIAGRSTCRAANRSTASGSTWCAASMADRGCTGVPTLFMAVLAIAQQAGVYAVSGKKGHDCGDCNQTQYSLRHR